MKRHQIALDALSIAFALALAALVYCTHDANEWIIYGLLSLMVVGSIIAGHRLNRAVAYRVRNRIVDEIIEAAGGEAGEQGGSPSLFAQAAD